MTLCKIKQEWLLLCVIIPTSINTLIVSVIMKNG